MKKLETKKKLINHIMKNGEKKTSEKIFLQSFKELQKSSTKKTKELIKLALLNSIPIFKLHKIKNKKLKKKKRNIQEIPSFIRSNQSRVSQAIKLILKSIKKNDNFYKNFNKEVLLSSQNKGEAVRAKNELQKDISSRFLHFFKWDK